MNPTLIIKSIKNKRLLNDEQYNFILENIGKPLQLASAWFDREGQLVHLTLYFGDTVITLFDDNIIEGEFNNGIEFQLGQKKMHSYI